MGYRRGSRAGSYSNPKGGRMSILNGGRDAPLTQRRWNIFYAVVLAVVALGFILIIVTEATR